MRADSTCCNGATGGAGGLLRSTDMGPHLFRNVSGPPLLILPLPLNFFFLIFFGGGGCTSHAGNGGGRPVLRCMWL